VCEQPLGVPRPQLGAPAAPQAERPGWRPGELVAKLGPLIALVAACLFFTLATQNFLSGNNFSLVVQQVMVVGTLAIGQTLIILTAGIDLSNGASMALGSMVMTKLAVDSGVPPVLAIVLGMLVCVAIGCVNGALVTRVRLPPFIVTLGALNIAFALTQIYSQDETISPLPKVMNSLGDSFQLGSTAITYGSLVTWRCLPSRGSCSRRRPGGGASMPSATTPRRRG
jgi:fructose transport system permease protein